MSFYKQNFLSVEESAKLSTLNFICKNTIILYNLPEEMLNKDKLYKKQFLGKYGRINSIIFKTSKTNKTIKKTIVKFDTINQAALSIISLNNFNIGKNKIDLKFGVK